MFPFFPTPLGLGNHHSISCFHKFNFPGFWVWEHTVFVFLCLAYFTWHNVFTVHPCCCKWQDILLAHGQVISHGICFFVCLSHSGVLDSLQPHGLYLARVLCPWDFPGTNTDVGCHFLLQWIFQTQRSNPGLSHCRQILLLSEPQGKPLYKYISILEECSWRKESEKNRMGQREGLRRTYFSGHLLWFSSSGKLWSTNCI